MARMPPAAGRFSMTSGWRRSSPIFCAIGLASRSMPTPGGPGMMSRIGCDGYSCAAAVAVRNSAKTKRATAMLALSRRLRLVQPRAIVGSREIEPGNFRYDAVRIDPVDLVIAGDDVIETHRFGDAGHLDQVEQVILQVVVARDRAPGALEHVVIGGVEA